MTFLLTAITSECAPPVAGASEEEETPDPQKMMLLKGFESRWYKKSKIGSLSTHHSLPELWLMG